MSATLAPRPSGTDALRLDRRWGLLAVSVVLHVLVLAPLALRLIQPEPPIQDYDPPVVLMQVEPRPLLEGERPRPATRPPAQEAVRPAADTAPAALSPTRPQPRDEEDEDRPTSPLPRVGTAPPAGVTIPNDWTVRPEALGDRVARSLREGIPGCRMRRGEMTDAEQAACDERFGQAAAGAAPIVGSGDRERDARFAAEGARALAQYEARRAPLSGGVGVSGASPDCVGGNLRGTCAGAHLREHYQRPEENFAEGGRSAPQ